MKKILIIQTAFLGDVILATPVIEKLHVYYPEADIDFLLRKGKEELFKDHPLLREVLVWDKEQDKLGKLMQMIGRVRKRKYDLVVNLQRHMSTGLLTGFSGAKQRVGFNKNPLSFLFTHKLPHVISESGEGVHETDRNLSLIAHLSDKKPLTPKLYPSESDFKKVKESGPYVCMAPNSVWFTKQWPADNWVKLIDRIPADKNVLLIGGAGDRLACDEIMSKAHHPNVMNLCGLLSLLQSAALMKGAGMNYVNDSAPLHLCSAVNAPVTAIFCSTVPRFGFGPLSGESVIAETKNQLDCRPCGLHGFKACPKGHFKCSEIEINI